MNSGPIFSDKWIRNIMQADVMDFDKFRFETVSVVEVYASCLHSHANRYDKMRSAYMRSAKTI